MGSASWRRCLTIHSSRRRFAARLNSSVRRVVNDSRQIEIWNRAATDYGGPTPAAGDRALAAVLLAHGIVMNGGVAHAREVLSQEQLTAAVSGFHYFGIPAAAEALSQSLADTDEASDAADQAYWHAVPGDDMLGRAFRNKLLSAPEAFAPIVGGPHA